MDEVIFNMTHFSLIYATKIRVHINEYVVIGHFIQNLIMFL